MTDINKLLTDIRDFLHIEEPSERECSALYKKLERNLEHQDIWLPRFQEHARWSQEPLVWSHIEGMGPGMLPGDVYGPSSVKIEEYAKVFPEGSVKILLRGGKDPGINTCAAPSALVRRCVHLCIDHPEWSHDAGQDGQYSGSSDILEIFDGALKGLKGQLQSLHSFTFKAAQYSSLSSTDTDPPAYNVQTSLWPNDYGRKGGFDKLKRLIEKRHSLRRLTLSNKSPLSEAHYRTGRIRPYCAWLPRCSWWPQLEALDLHQNLLNDGDLAWLFSAPMPTLTTLSLRKNKLMDQALMHLTREGAFPALESLDLRETLITAQAAQALRESPQLPRLTSVLI